MALLRNSQSLDLLKEAYQSGNAEKDLRSYHIPRYQQEMLNILAKDSGLSKAGVVREIIDEWYDLKLKSLENGSE